jgi:protein phosphatase
LLVAVRTNKYLTLGYVGDCRAYLVRDNTIKLLTEDHSLVMYLYKSGQIKKEEIRTHPDRNKILRSIGATTNLVVDGLEKVLNEPVLELKDGDIIILCTDGVWDKIEDEEILNTVLSKEIEDPAYTLVEKANNYGGEDNSTVVVVKVVKRG